MNPVHTFELEFNDAGDKFTTSVFQLLQWKHALKLEKVGLTMSRGKKVSTHMRKLMSLKRNTPVDYLIEWTEGVLELLNPTTKTHTTRSLEALKRS